MPEQLLRECSNRNKALTLDFIMESFDVSDVAAEKRKKTLANTVYEWRTREEKEFDDIILMKMHRNSMKLRQSPKNMITTTMNPIL